MDDFLKMDLFFVVATAAVIITGMLASFALFYLVRILRSISAIAKEVEEDVSALKRLAAKFLDSGS